MQANMGTIDKIIRLIIGIALLSLVFWWTGNARWIGLIGIIPLLTISINWCPLYTVLGVRTNKAV